MQQGMRGCRYFPYQHDTETVPQAHNQFIEQASKEAFGTQAPLTQQRAATQAHASADANGEVISLDSDDEAAAALAPHPTFEVFWQVRHQVVRCTDNSSGACAPCTSSTLQVSNEA